MARAAQSSRRRLGGCAGQTLVETALVLPFVLLIAFGVIETGYYIVDAHVVSKLAREGSNLTSRTTTLEDAITALRSMSSSPVDFNTRSKIILSVLKRGERVGTANYDKIFLYQRHSFGAMPASSKLTLRGAGAFGGAPDYIAVNANDNAGLQVLNVPDNLIVPLGGVIYITEVATTHELLTPLPNFGITWPSTVYSIAYF
jgi:hypothetical protein